MAINETMGVVAQYTTAGGKVLSRRASNLTIMDTSTYDVIIDVTRDWMTTAAASKYGTLYVKPTINIADEIIRRGGTINASFKYLINIAADVAVVADNEVVGALHADSRIPAGTNIDCNCYGLLLGRGGMGASPGVSHLGVLGKGGVGGPAVNSRFATIKVTVYGGLSGGGGGGGGRGAVYKLGWYNTGINEYWLPDTHQPISGAGAPFGLRVGTLTSGNNAAGSEEFFYKNPSLVKTFDEAPSAVVQTYAPNRHALDEFKGVTVSVNMQTMQVIGYVNNTGNLLLSIDKPVIEVPEILRTWHELQPDNNIARMSNFETTTNEHLIREADAWLYSSNRYAGSSGAKIKNTGAAGLFRGAEGAVPGRLNTGGLERYLGASSQDVVDRVAQRLQGTKGGDLGQSLGLAKALEPVTVHAGYYNGGYRFEILDGLQGWDHQFNRPIAETFTVIPPTTGGVAGANSQTLSNGKITITASGGGVLGGPAVLAKYDPNGTFDTLARGTDVLKTFKPLWYRE